MEGRPGHAGVVVVCGRLYRRGADVGAAWQHEVRLALRNLSRDRCDRRDVCRRAAGGLVFGVPGMTSTLSFASMAMLGILVAIAIVFVVVMVRVIRVVSGRGTAKREGGGEAAMLSMALQDALTKLKQQERAMAARAEASERLADQIVEGLTSGLVVVDRTGTVQAINPAA